MVLEELARIEAEKIAEAAVSAHGALVAQVEKDLNASFERDLKKEREKVETLEKLAEEARMELDRLRAEREEEKNILLGGRAAVESEMEVLSKLRSEVEEQLHSVLSKKVEISFEKSRIEKLQKEIENENLAVVQLQYELEVERKALSMARQEFLTLEISSTLNLFSLIPNLFLGCMLSLHFSTDNVFYWFLI